MRPTGSHVLTVITVAASLALAWRAGLAAECLVLIAGLALINQTRTMLTPVPVQPAAPALRQRYHTWRDNRDDARLTRDDRYDLADWSSLRAEARAGDWTRPFPAVQPAGSSELTITLPVIPPAIYGPELPESGSLTARVRGTAKAGLDEYEASLPAFGRDAAG
jgi:hypothetical protein